MKRILIVDDNLDVLDTLTLLLEGQYDVRTAVNGVEALTLVQDEPFDAVLLDVMMPMMSGDEAFEQMRQRGVDVPVALVSASRDIERIAARTGADAFLRKPLKLDDLEMLLGRLLGDDSSSPSGTGSAPPGSGPSGGLSSSETSCAENSRPRSSYRLLTS